MLGRAYCPGCEPDADVLTEALDTRYCPVHELRMGGSDDDHSTARGAPTMGEAGGEDNRAWCSLIHGTRE